MKAYLFIETGEIRQPKAGEYFSISSGVLKCVADRVVMPSPILTRHEIPIPEGANDLLVDFSKDGLLYHALTHCPLPRPKKVKKWQWLYRSRNGDFILTKGVFLSEAEIFRFYSDCISIIGPLLESEIEVDE